MISKKEVLESNIELHARLSKVYKSTEPHYRPENIAKIETVLQGLVRQSGADMLLDIGCGAGFIIDIAKKYFKKIRGVDITPEMIQQIDTNHPECDIQVQLATTEDLPFENNQFNMVTAYAVLHHLHDLSPVFNEIYRVMKPGGVFYSDLDPNFYFWDSIKLLSEKQKYSAFVEREIYAVKHKDQELEDNFDIDKDLLLKSEHLKHISGGFKEEDITQMLEDAGFSKVQIIYEWFIGEGNMIHDESLSMHADATRNFLHECLPLTRHLFKYIRVIATK